MTVHREIRDRILLVTIDNAPVNALSQIERQGLVDAVEFGESADVDAMIICGIRGNFIAGADVREFDKPPAPPLFADVVDRIEASSKPVIAAIEGVALGGGLEIAMGCHYRLARLGAVLGLPEVNLGVVPGAGGSQRLPRIADLLLAARMMVGGKPIGPAEALAAGLIDQMVEGELTDAAFAFARTIIGKDIAPRRASSRPNPDAASVRAELDAYAAKVRASSRDAIAPLAALDLVEAAIALPFAEGLARERETFVRLRDSDQAAAFSHIFFAERTAAKPPADVAGAAPRPIERVGVIGAGTMGTGIAMSIADHGLPVQLVELSEKAMASGLGRIATAYRSAARKGRITEQQAAVRTDLIRGSTQYADLAQCDLIIEAAFEALDVKREIFSQLGAIAKPGALLATNTSYLDVDVIAEFSGRASDVVGMHYFSPANVMKLMEVVRPARAAPDAIVSAIAFAKRTGKIPVVAGVCTGFIGNRMFKSYVREAGLLLLEGASPQDVDAALVDFGMAMGPFAVADLTGIDIAHKARQNMAPGSFEPMAVLVHDALVERGQLGRKTGRGFYVYGDDGKAEGPNPDVAIILEEVRGRAAATSRSIGRDEIVERCIMALVDEGGLILDEGIAARAGDIDVIYVNGYGFPRSRGGPMFFADRMGLDKVRAKIQSYAGGPFGHWWGKAGHLGFPA